MNKTSLFSVTTEIHINVLSKVNISFALDELYFDLFVPNASFLYPLKTSENLTVF